MLSLARERADGLLRALSLLLARLAASDAAVRHAALIGDRACDGEGKGQGRTGQQHRDLPHHPCLHFSPPGILRGVDRVFLSVLRGLDTAVAVAGPTVVVGIVVPAVVLRDAVMVVVAVASVVCRRGRDGSGGAEGK